MAITVLYIGIYFTLNNSENAKGKIEEIFSFLQSVKKQNITAENYDEMIEKLTQENNVTIEKHKESIKSSN